MKTVLQSHCSCNLRFIFGFNLSAICPAPTTLSYVLQHTATYLHIILLTCVCLFCYYIYLLFFLLPFIHTVHLLLSHLTFPHCCRIKDFWFITGGLHQLEESDVFPDPGRAVSWPRLHFSWCPSPQHSASPDQLPKTRDEGQSTQWHIKSV